MKNISSGIREIVNIQNPNSHKISQLKVGGKLINNPRDISNKLNEYFVNVGPTTEDSIPKTQNVSTLKFMKERINYAFLIAQVSHDEVLNIINSLEYKATGPVSIPIKLLKLIPDLILVPLCNIINVSFNTGVFPNLLKLVRIPIHKRGSKQDINNYRLISLLSVFDKIMEKLMHKRLYSFLEEKDILYHKQFGFRKGNSTINALLQITEKIKESIDKGKYGCGIFIDLRKAFDTVNHKILLMKMEHYGIRDSALRWFESYLNKSSQLRELSCGVPRGSVLGPLLFLIYINDLPNISKKLEIFLFADDTNIYYENESLVELELIVNKELRNLYLWLSVNRLALNIAKTIFLIFHPFNKSLRYNVTLKILKQAIVEKNYIKYLGVIIDSTLSWKDQLHNLSKLSRTIGVLYKLRPFVNLQIMKNTYHALFYLHIVYGIHV